MKGLTFSFLAAGCAASSSLCIRKNAESKQKDISGFLTIYYLISMLASFLVFPEIWSTTFSPTMFFLGCFVGVFNMLVMVLIGSALRKGSSAMTFAFQNASSIFPGVILFAVFGPEFGYNCTIYQYLGIALVMLGLFIGTNKKEVDEEKPKINKKWLKYVLGAFLAQVLAMTIIQGRCIFFESDKLEGFLSFFESSKSADVWFMPGMFSIGFVIQMILFFKDKRKFAIKELTYGFFGGLLNFASTWLLLLATIYAASFEKIILLPSFAVIGLILCSIWSRVLYKEEFNYKANALCAVGVFVGSII